jgi:hypothetical protein
MKQTNRFEYKYQISYLDYFKIIDSLKTLLIHDQHGEEDFYPVTSIYLDDVYFSGAADKAFGNELHKKYRIRYYHDDTIKKLELKEKTGNESVKYSCSINDELYKGILEQDMDVLEKYFDEQLVRKYTLEMLRKNTTPKCNIFYKREALKDETDNLRVTFDHSLGVSRFDDQIDGEYIKLLRDSHLIMEVKYEHFLPKHIKTILNTITLNQIAYSKYFMGYNQILL